MLSAKRTWSHTFSIESQQTWVVLMLITGMMYTQYSKADPAAWPALRTLLAWWRPAFLDTVRPISLTDMGSSNQGDHLLNGSDYVFSDAGRICIVYCKDHFAILHRHSSNTNPQMGKRFHMIRTNSETTASHFVVVELVVGGKLVVSSFSSSDAVDIVFALQSPCNWCLAQKGA